MTGDGTRTTYQAIVVGGGPAGSTTSRLLAEAGCRVLLLDKAVFPRHKACSDYLNPAAVRALRELGMMEALWTANPHPMQAMRVHAPGNRMFQAAFREVEPGHVALGISRYRLDHLLLQRAATAGVEIRERAHVRDLVLDRGRVVGVEVSSGGVRETIRAPIVIGADGHHSVVSRRSGARCPGALATAHRPGRPFSRSGAVWATGANCTSPRAGMPGWRCWKMAWRPSP